MLTKKKKTTVREDPNVTAGRQMLVDFGKTGQWGDYKAGEEYGGSFGAFDPSEIERLGLGRLSSLVSGGDPELFGMGERALNDLLTGDRFDPYSDTGEFKPFSTAVDREVGTAAANTRNQSAFNRNLYSTATMRDIGDINARGMEAKTGKLAELFSEYTGRKLAGIPLAFQAAGQKQGMEMDRLGAAFQYGKLPRELEDLEATRRMSDWYRQRQEKLLPMQAIESVVNADAVSSMTIPGQSPYQGAFDQLGGLGMSQLIQQLFAK